MERGRGRVGQGVGWSGAGVRVGQVRRYGRVGQWVGWGRAWGRVGQVRG